ncbi:MAG: hypothetical protein LUG98_03400 [Tannerellaceae bacterium]|nr:hypothetical protein [Tannerellaceae bacterium]
MKTLLRFFPGPSGTPVSFQGILKESTAFREALSTLYDFSLSGEKEKNPASLSASSISTDKPLRLATSLQAAQPDNKQLEIIRKELEYIREQKKQILAPFDQAKKKYTAYLQQQAPRMAPPRFLLTVHPEEIHIEYFNAEASLYGRLTCGKEAFHAIRDIQSGTTVPDYASDFYEMIRGIRSYKETMLQIAAGPEEEQVRQEPSPSFTSAWFRGFLQMNATSGMPADLLELRPVDILNICHAFTIPTRKTGAHGLSFYLTPGQPVRIQIEDSGKEIVCHQTLYTGKQQKRIRVWGGEKLQLLTRILPLVDSCKLLLHGTGYPFFLIAEMGAITFTTGFNGWEANDWRHAGQTDLLAPPALVSRKTEEHFLNLLKEKRKISLPDTMSRLRIEKDEAQLTGIALLQKGRVIYNPLTENYSFRELIPGFPAPESLRFSSTEEKEACKLSHTGIELSYTKNKENIHIEGDMKDGKWIYSALAVLSKDLELENGQCDCGHHRKIPLQEDPCRHILAVRMAFASSLKTH